MAIDQTQIQKVPPIPGRFPAPTMDWFMYLVRTLHDGQIRCVITFADRVDAERIALATRLTLDAEPILGCRFIEHPRRPYWERCDDLDYRSFCPVVESPDLEYELCQFMAEPVDPCTGPQVQARIFRSDRDTLCLKVNHMVADAGGTLDYASLLAKTYRELGKSPDYYPEPNLSASRGQGQVLRNVGRLQLIRSFFSFSSPRSPTGFPVTSQDFSGRSFATRRIGSDRLAGIKAFCNRNHTSVNDVLLAAFYRSLFDVLSPPVRASLPVQVTVNLRRHLPKGKAGAICDLAGVFFPVIKRKPGDTFSDTLCQVQTASKDAQRGQPWLGGSLYLEMFFLPGFSLARRTVYHLMKREVAAGRLHPFFANVGIIEPRQVDFGEVKVIDVAMFGPVAYPPACILSVNTFGDTMIFTTSFCNTATDERIVGRLLDLMVYELPE